MIRFEAVETYGWEAAVRGMRNPKNSWNKSDSVFSFLDGHPHLGPNDKKLMATLRKAGTDHRKFLRMIVVSLDITAPLYWWAEFDTYKVGTVRNSCSKMHKLLEKPFEMNDFSFDKLPGYRNEVKQFPPEADEETEVWCECVIDKGYHVSDCGRIRHNMRVLSGSLHQDGYAEKVNLYEEVARPWIDVLNELRDSYMRCLEEGVKKEIWYAILQLLPESYNQLATVMLNYEVLANIYKSRRNHKLDEWHAFCDWIETLPYSWLITGKEASGDE